MANVGVISGGETQIINGIAGVNDNDIVIELESAERWNEFTLGTLTGVVDVDVSIDGTNFKAAIALTDLQSTTPATRVAVTVATGVYQFNGTYKTVRVRQNGATAAASTTLLCSRSGRG